MKIWNRLGISPKIRLSLGAMVLLLAGVSGVAWLNLATIDTAADVVTGKTEATLEAESLKTSLLNSETLVTAYTLTESDGDRAAANAGLDRLKSHLDALSASAAPGERLVTELGQSYQSYEIASRSLLAAVGTRNKSSDDFTQAATAIATTTGAIVTALFRENRTDVLPTGTKLNDIPQAGTVAVTRYLATRNPAYANTAKQLITSLNESIEAIRASVTESNRIQRFLKVLGPQIIDYTQTIDALISATDKSGRASAERKSAAGRLLSQIEALTEINIGEQTTAVQTMHNSVTQARTIISVLSLIALLFAAFSSRVLELTIVTTLLNLEPIMRRLAKGDLAVEVPSQDRADELGGMARAVQVFKVNMIMAERLAEQERTQQEARQQRTEQIEVIVHDFDQIITTVVHSVAVAATQLQADAQNLSATADQTSQQAVIVSAAAQQASVNVQTVASAADELGVSVGEISRQVVSSMRIAESAVKEANNTNATVSGLSDAAQKIGDVVKLINGIASQTNLLALNATIEAARAGQAGKGFAVVASEVKNLANQTAKATEDIQVQVGEMRAVTSTAVEAIKRITDTILNMSEIATTIATAVEEQGAATREIARNVIQASSGANEVSHSIGGVSEAAASTGRMAVQTFSAASSLSQQSSRLRNEVDGFISKVRAT